MRRLLRSLEKRLIMERTELAVLPLVHDLLSRWDHSLTHRRLTPDTLDFVAGLIKAGFCLTTAPKASTYLDGCRWSSSMPDKQQLLQILVPGYTLKDRMAPSGPLRPYRTTRLTNPVLSLPKDLPGT